MTPHNLQQIIKGDSRQLGDIFALIANAEATPLEQWREKCANSLFERLLAGDTLDPALIDLLGNLKPHFVNFCRNDDIFYSNASHPLRQLFTWILREASHWCPRDARSDQNYLQKVQHVIEIAIADCEATDHSFSALEQALNDLYSWQETENKRATLLETRLCENELIHLKMLTAECRVLDLLNEALADTPLPTDLHNDIATTLKSELQHCVFNAQNLHANGDWSETPFWKCWQRLLPHIGSIFSHDDIQIDDQRLYALVPALLGELERSLEIPTSNVIGYQHLVDNLSTQLMLAVQKQPVECRLFAALPYPDGHSAQNTHITQTLHEESNALKQGDWILFENDNHQLLRCKLALKNNSVDQLLFVDYSGKKVMIKSSKDLALCISTRIAKPLKIRTPEMVIAERLQIFLDHAETLREQHKQAQALANEKRLKVEQEKITEAAKQQELQQAQMEEQLAARKAAARKAMAEARALAEHRIRREEEQKQELERLREQEVIARAKEEEAHYKAAVTLASELHVGAWLELHINDLPVRSKLSVIISSTGKYIFVDQVGRKLAEHTREQLAQLLAIGKAKVISKGDKFEDQLAKVIRGLRKDISS